MGILTIKRRLLKEFLKEVKKLEKCSFKIDREDVSSSEKEETKIDEKEVDKE